MIIFNELKEFQKDLKGLKKFKSINSDLTRFKKALETKLELDCNSKLPGTERISGLGKDIKIPIFKVKHFRCETLKGKGSRSGFRIIYGFQNETVHLIEIYHKNRKQKEDKERIKKYFSETN